jgi:16S rRNA C1402 (ribose-2'-O) methylase RsmI
MAILRLSLCGTASVSHALYFAGGADSFHAFPGFIPTEQSITL